MLINAQGGDNQRQRHAGHQRPAAVGEVGEPAPQQGAHQRAHFEQGEALNRHLFGKLQLLEGIHGRPLVDTDTHHIQEDVREAEQPDHFVFQHVLNKDLPFGHLVLFGLFVLFADLFVKQLFGFTQAIGFRGVAAVAQADKADDQGDNRREDKHADDVAVEQDVRAEQRHACRTRPAEVVGDVPHPEVRTALTARGPFGDGGVAARPAGTLEETAQGVEGDHHKQADRARAHAGAEAEHTDGGEDQHKRQELLGVFAVGVIGNQGFPHPVGDGEAEANHPQLGHAQPVGGDHVVLGDVKVFADQVHGQVADKDHQIGLHEGFEPHFAPHIERQIQGRLAHLV